MKENTAQKLTLEVIEKSNSQYEELKPIEVKLEIDGEIQTFELGVYEKFSPVSIKELIVEYISKIDLARKVNKDGFGNILEPYLMYLIIKHFTELGESMPNDFKKQLSSMKQMMNNSSFFQILSQFDEKEINKIKEQLEVMIATVNENSEALEELRKEYFDKLQDKSLLD